MIIDSTIIEQYTFPSGNTSPMPRNILSTSSSQNTLENPVSNTITDQKVRPSSSTSGRDRVSASLARGRPAST